ncbi:uncharacterized protein FIBRA_04362 [Fibroporia radiculosa]|uniref:Uncharacterized protein n=1 Tax=Fibroporia radiculosa TaxID=599839 RepID=J4HWH6_9APHY|nr:uncharacterized protein FIBRA_04362 [Fibroporia radiculosa]CCM02277.1 predicted protein [Fibroporia radiculosa]
MDIYSPSDIFLDIELSSPSSFPEDSDLPYPVNFEHGNAAAAKPHYRFNRPPDFSMDAFDLDLGALFPSLGSSRPNAVQAALGLPTNFDHQSDGYPAYCIVS